MAARRIALCLPDGMTPHDPDPAETTRRDVELVHGWDESAGGVIGLGEGGWRAVELAATQRTTVERLVLVSTQPLEAEHASWLEAVEAKTLLLYGSRDGGQRQATWWKEHLGGRIEMVPGEGGEILGRVWARALSHVAPGTIRA
ncbi:MAG TPA: hypothetical protein VFU84_08480 [Gaiellaceae bacterium]|nr:hypothetical protein [Gaiellaceae bacterium]